MYRNTSLAVTFSPTAEIEVASNGQLLQTDAASRPREFSSKARAVAVAEGSLDGDATTQNAGVTFHLASSDRCFDQMVLGLTSSHNQSESVDFCVCLEQDRYYSTVISIKDSGAEAYSMTGEGDERVTIRLDGSCANVEFLVNDMVVHTSKKCVRFPLACKVVNIIRRNIIPNIVTNLPQEWCMRLPVKHLQWTKAVFDVLTLRVVNIGDEGIVITSCINVAGEELVRIESVGGQSIANLKEALSRQIGGDIRQIRLLDDGRLLTDSEEWPERAYLAACKYSDCNGNLLFHKSF